MWPVTQRKKFPIKTDTEMTEMIALGDCYYEHVK